MAQQNEQIAILVDSIAKRENIDPLDAPPLAEVVDTDALRNILNSESDVTVSFDYAGYSVQMDSEENIEID